jgi:hypothetical protein
MIDGRAYALPFDDQGGFSSDLNSTTTPEEPASVTITLGPWAAPATQIIDNGDAAPAYSEIGNLGLPWNNQGYAGDVREIIGPGKSASYQFRGLEAGEVYDVSTTWTPFLNRETRAPYSISGINGGPRTIQVDQTQSPNDFADGGASWERLGTFVVDEDGILTVTVSGTNIRSVIADAVRIDRRDDSEIGVFHAGGEVISTLSSIDIGRGLMGAGSSKVFTISNHGTADLVLGSTLSLPAGFERGTANNPAVLFDGVNSVSVAPGESVSFEVRLSAMAAGNYGGTVSFTTNDADEANFSFNVTGTVLGNTLIMDDGDAEYSDSGNVVRWLQGYQGDVREGVVGGVVQSAQYVTPSLPAGTYRISATWTPYYNRATNAPYTINGGAPVLVNQKLAPSQPAATPENSVVLAQGVYFADLDSSFAFSGGVLTVGVSDVGANGNVIFDAIRIERLGPLAPPTVLASYAPVTGAAVAPATRFVSSTLAAPAPLDSTVISSVALPFSTRRDARDQFFARLPRRQALEARQQLAMDALLEVRTADGASGFAASGRLGRLFADLAAAWGNRRIDNRDATFWS